MIVAGVDPGTVKAGIAILETEGDRFSPILLDVIELPKRLPRYERIHRLYVGLVEFLSQHRPETVGIERAFFARHPAAALALGEARGAAIVAASNAGADIVEFAPKEARKVALLKGNSTKEDAQRMVGRLLGIKRQIPLDASDAAVLAMAAASIWKPPDIQSKATLGRRKKK